MTQSRWNGDRADTYDQAWKRMEQAGQNPHGEVDFVMGFEPTSVLDAGCGTGRVALELDRRAVHVVGTDLDEQMLAVAAAKAPHLTWVASDLATLNLDQSFDVVVMAGNIVLFVAAGTEAAVVAGAARHVGPGGHLVAGFGLGRGVTADEWEQYLLDGGLEPTARYSTWSGDPFSDAASYLVSVSQRR